MKEKKILCEKSTIAVAADFLESLKAEQSSVCEADARLVAMVKKTDLQKAFDHNLQGFPVDILLDYKDDDSETVSKLSRQRLQELYEMNLSEEVRKSIRMCSNAATQLNLKAYLVGGPVRDILRQKQNLDIDITIEGDVIHFAKILSETFENVLLKETHEEFTTAKCVFNSASAPQEIDFASTRTEIYTHPGTLPTVQQIGCSINEDLARRDFTINAMALDISTPDRLELIDPFNGLSDLKKGILRVLHSYSFIDDPTRIIRAMEFALRFDYRLSQKTEKLAINLIKAGVFDGYCNDRLKLEVKPLLNLNNSAVAELIQKYSLYRLFHKEIVLNETYTYNMHLFSNLLKSFAPYFDTDKTWLIYLMTLFSALGAQQISDVVDRLYLTNKEKKAIQEGCALITYFSANPLPESPSGIYKIFHKKENEAIIGALYQNNETRLGEEIRTYFESYSKTKLATDGQTLLDLGFKPGPVFSKILNELLLEKIDGTITTPEQEIEFIQKHY